MENQFQFADVHVLTYRFDLDICSGQISGSLRTRVNEKTELKGLTDSLQIFSGTEIWSLLVLVRFG